MLTGPSDPRLRRYRPLLALAAGLLIALGATSGAIALAERSSERTVKTCAGSHAASSDTPSSEAAETASTGASASAASASALSAGSAASAASTASPAAPAADDGSTGLDLEVRIGRIRVEFPWLKTLPITPGRHVVFTLLPSFDSEAR